MSQRLALSCLLLAAVLPLRGQALDPTSDPNVQPGSPTSLNGYRLVWSDEFNGTAVDEVKWKYREGDDSRNFIKSFQTAANNSVSGGLYRCLLKKETMGTKAYTAGGIISREQMRYGYYESSFKVPASRGWHSSFWMMPTNGGGPVIELDVIENDSIHPYEYSVNIHRHQPTPHLQYGAKAISTPDLSANFHTFGCEYTPTAVRYFFNGTLVQEVDATQFEHGDMNIWLTSIGLVYDHQDPIDDTQLPTEAVYDYVRFFELGPHAIVEIFSPEDNGATVPDTATTVELLATVTTVDTVNSPTIQWTKLSGPGEVSFTQANQASTGAQFAEEGLYELVCSATVDGVTNSDSVSISVNAPRTVSFQQGANGYDMVATFIREQNDGRNSGADDEVIVGYHGGAMRGLMRFDLGDLDPNAQIESVELTLYSHAGTGTTSTIELRELTSSFMEGTGSGSSDADGAGTGATWLQRTGDNYSLATVTTSAGTVDGFSTVTCELSASATDYLYVDGGSDPGAATDVLSDQRIDTGVLNLGDSTEFHFNEVLSVSHVIAIIYDASSGIYYDQPGSVSAYDQDGLQVGTSVAIPDLEASSFTSLSLARPSNGSTLAGRGIFGCVVPVADFGGDAESIAMIRLDSTPQANETDVHYVGSALAEGALLTVGVQAIASVTAEEGWDSSGVATVSKKTGRRREEILLQPCCPVSPVSIQTLKRIIPLHHRRHSSRQCSLL